jgi:Flp pilus assembly protein TadB
MKTLKTARFILIAILISVSAFSQGLPPRKATLNKTKGVFITFATMDTISLRLIERKSLKVQNSTLLSLYNNEKEKNKQTQDKSDLIQNDALKWQNLYYKTEGQKRITENNVDLQKIETKKARSNGLKFFGGGVIVGVALFTTALILIN